MKKYIFWIIILAAIAVRLIYYVQIKDEFLFTTPILDAKYYAEWAREIASGDWLGAHRGVFMMSPGYSYFLAASYLLVGSGIPATVFIQFLLGLLTGILVYLIGKKIYSQNVGLLAMVFYLFYSVGIFYESAILKAALVNFVNLLAVYLVLRRTLCALLGAGALVGFSVHLRPNILAFVPFVLLWLWLSDKEKRVAVVFFFAGLILMLLPVGLRNYAVGREFVFSTAHGGMNFYTGNSNNCKGPYTPMPFARTDPEVEQQDFMAEASRRSGKALTPKESSAFWYRQSGEFITGNFIAWARLMGKKIFIFFNAYEPPINLDYYFFRQEYASVLSWPLFGYGLILPLAVIGLCSVSCHPLLVSYAAVYFLVNVAFFVVSEYRFPVVPVLCVYAALGCISLWHSYAQRKTQKLVTALAVLGVFLFMVNSDVYSNVFGFPNYKKANLANSYFGMGVTYEGEKSIEKAIAAYKKAIAIMPQSAPLINLATMYENKGEFAAAQALYEKALFFNPSSAEAHNNLGAIFFKQNDFEKALSSFDRALALNPNFHQAQKNLEITEAIVRKSKK